MQFSYLVLTNPTDGHDEAFNTWYDSVHLPEVLALPGIVAAKRLIRSRYQRSEAGFEYPYRYLTIYDLGEDARVGLKSLTQAALTPATDLAPGTAGVVFETL